MNYHYFHNGLSFEDEPPYFCSYHLRRGLEVPTKSKATRAVMEKFLRTHVAPHKLPKFTGKDKANNEFLWGLCEAVIRELPCRVDDILRAKNIELLCLPPRHPGKTHFSADKVMLFDTLNKTLLDITELNLSEFVWAEGKGDFAKRNASMKVADVVPEIQRSLLSIPHSSFQNGFAHVLRQAKRYFEVRNQIVTISDEFHFNK